MNDPMVNPSGNLDSNASADFLRRLRGFVHRRLIDSIEHDGVAVLEDAREVRKRVADILEQVKDERGIAVSAAQSKQLQHEILEELGGMGPLASLMLDSHISDILINGPDEVWVDRAGHLQKTDVQFDDAAHLRRFLDRIIGRQGRHLDTSNPMVDARLPDGSRLHAVIPPLCSRGPVVSIRRFRTEALSADELVSRGVLSRDMLALLELAVSSGQNLIISGSAAAGKTTLLNILSGYIPANERVITVEETAELQLEHPHVITLESRPTNSEGRGGVGLRELVRTALRMRADRIIVGEVRGEEVIDMLQAMNVGHDGSLATLHANSPRDVVQRIESLALMGDSGLSRESIRDMVGSAIQLIVQVMRFRDGSRRVVSICELRQNAAQLELVELFKFKPGGLDAQERIRGEHVACEATAAFVERAQALGYQMPVSAGTPGPSHDADS